MKTKLFLTGLALMAITVFANGQDPVVKQGRGNGQRNGQCCGRCNGTGKGAAFVDKNNNGVCDNFENSTTNKTDSTKIGIGKRNGCGQGLRQGKGRGRNFVDANKNGICDFYETNTKK
jgi:hypothetical protein